MKKINDLYVWVWDMGSDHGEEVVAVSDNDKIGPLIFSDMAPPSRKEHINSLAAQASMMTGRKLTLKRFHFAETVHKIP